MTTTEIDLGEALWDSAGGELVGVYTLEGQRRGRGKVGDRDVVVTFGGFSRWCVRTDLQGRGAGTQLVADAENRAHKDFEWDNMYAGVILSEEHTRVARSAFDANDFSLETEVYDELKEEDARLKVLSRRNWRFRGYHPNVAVGGSPRLVALMSKSKPT